MTVYYNVREYGEPDRWHRSELCAGNYTKEMSEEEVEDAEATPCQICAVGLESDGLDNAIDVSYEHAMDVFDPKQSLPFGFVMIQGLDGRSKVAGRLRNDDRFDVRSKNGSVRGPRGSTVKIRDINGQSMGPKIEAYRAFLELMRDQGYMENCSVYQRMD